MATETLGLKSFGLVLIKPASVGPEPTSHALVYITPCKVSTEHVTETNFVDYSYSFTPSITEL